MDVATFEWLLEQNGLAAVAILALIFMWYQHKESLRREINNAEVHRVDKGRIVEVLQEVARSNGELITLIRDLRDDLRGRKEM
jgi:hypothetical protein